jgi:hypothetical protein
MDSNKIAELKKKKLERMKKKAKELQAAHNKRYLKKKKQLQIKKDLHVKAMAEAVPFVPVKMVAPVSVGGRMRMRPRQDMLKNMATETMMDMAAGNVNEQLKKEYDEQKEITEETKIDDGDTQVSPA